MRAAPSSLLSLSFLVSVATACPPSTSQETPQPQSFDVVCPRPASLPFTTATQAFVDDDNAEVAADERVKDEASDLVGDDAGHVAVTVLDVDAAPEDVFSFVGRKARSSNNNGLIGSAIAGEAVSFWSFVDDDGFVEVADAVTDDGGRYDVVVADAPARRTLAVLEGDQSCAEHSAWLLPARTKVIVTDIDGTLTTDDNELLVQIGDATHDPQQKGHALALAQAWDEKGYVVVYLSARPHAFRAETRAWLVQHGYPPGPLLTANSLVVGDTARDHKIAWLTRLQGFGWDIVAAYGNATSDIDAYDGVGIAKDITFIIGPEAGADGTVAIADDDYADHIAGFVDAQPAL